MIAIREARPDDIRIIHDFQLRLAQETENVELNPSTLAMGLHAVFADQNKGRYYVAEEDGQVIGCHSVTFEWSDWRNGVIWWMQSLYVEESHRQKGVFRLMFDNVMANIKDDPSVKGLRLYCDKSNAAAQKAYTAMGMNGDHYTVFEKMA